jgi:4-diphosphocytidyl-2-C-methyl-D-erythritol kinase
VKVTVAAPAKINISLSVGPLRADGFHELATVFHALDIHDTLTVVADEPGCGPRLSVTGIGVADVPTDDTNLAMRAVRLLAQHVGRDPDVALTLHKVIPTAGGLAGGSSDAAAALIALDSLWHTRLGPDELDALAARLGSDVAFCLHGGTMVGSGRGEQLTELHTGGILHWVIAVAPVGLSTPAVYAELDRLRGEAQIEAPSVSQALISALRTADIRGIAAAMDNDLQPAALSLRPSLAEVLSLGRSAGALAGIVSGSGPTCVFLAADAPSAQKIAAVLGDHHLVHRAVVTTGPVAGATAV